MRRFFRYKWNTCLSSCCVLSVVCCLLFVLLLFKTRIFYCILTLNFPGSGCEICASLSWCHSIARCVYVYIVCLCCLWGEHSLSCPFNKFSAGDLRAVQGEAWSAARARDCWLCRWQREVPVHSEEGECSKIRSFVFTAKRMWVCLWIVNQRNNSCP